MCNKVVLHDLLNNIPETKKKKKKFSSTSKCKWQPNSALVESVLHNNSVQLLNLYCQHYLLYAQAVFQLSFSDQIYSGVQGPLVLAGKDDVGSIEPSHLGDFVINITPAARTKTGSVRNSKTRFFITGGNKWMQLFSISWYVILLGKMKCGVL